MRVSLLWSSFFSIVAVSAQNLVQDPSFNIASSGGGWSIYGSSYARYYPGEGIDGSSCFGIASTSEQFDVASQPVSGLTVGGTYTLSFWLRYQSAAPTSVYVSVGDFFSGEVPSNQITSSWVQHTFTFTSTARTASLTIYGVNLPDWTYVDNVFLGLSGSSYNLVHDPGFEQSNPTSPWGLSGGSTAAIEAGSYDTSATSSSAPDVVSQLIRPLDTSKSYTLSFSAKVDGSCSSAHLTAAFGMFSKTLTCSALSNGWSTFSYEVRPTTDSITISFSAYSNDNTIYVDDVSITADSELVPSAIPARRKREAMKRRHQQLLHDHPFCPINMSACPVLLANGKKRDGAFECLDPATELNSCGGCIGQGGVDCEALPGVASVSCQQSQCVVSRCKSGFSLFDNACIA